MPELSLKALIDLSNSDKEDGGATGWNSQNSFTFKIFAPRRSYLSTTSLVDAPLSVSVSNPIRPKITFLAFNMPAVNIPFTRAKIVEKYPPQSSKSSHPPKRPSGGCRRCERAKTQQKALEGWLADILAADPKDLRGMNVCSRNFLNFKLLLNHFPFEAAFGLLSRAHQM